MPGVLQIGPLAIPLPALFAVVAIALGFLVGQRAGRKADIDAEPRLWQVLLVGVVVARLTFVLQWLDAYRQNPLGILDIRDGGWDVALGGAAAALYALSLVKRQPGLKRPLLAAGLVTGAIGAASTVALAFWPGQQARLPMIALQSLAGDDMTLAQFEGRPVVLNLWASWCGPCVREMPVLRDAQAAHPDLHFVFLNQGESARKVESFLRTRQLELANVVLDPHSRAGVELGRLALPTTLFFDAEGRLVSRRIGELSHATLQQRLAELGSSGSERPDLPSVFSRGGL